MHHLLGTIDTPQKFEAHRLEMAERVWTSMKQNDSRECRHCHDVTAMDQQQQGRTAQKQHQSSRAASGRASTATSESLITSRPAASSRVIWRSASARLDAMRVLIVEDEALLARA